jgi:hypothetical protein
MRRWLKSVTPTPILNLRQAFIDHRNSRRTAADVFSEVYRKRYWGGSDEFFSGHGSHNNSIVEPYIAALSQFAIANPYLDAVDIGCGDFNIGKQTRHLFRKYAACDVVPALIERNKTKFADCNVSFYCLDISRQKPPTGDVALIRQVFQHLSNAQIEAAVRNLAGFKFLIITEHFPGGRFFPNADKPQDSGIRPHRSPPSAVVLTEAPFNLAVKSSEVLCSVPTGEEFIQTTLYQSASS